MHDDILIGDEGFNHVRSPFHPGHHEPAHPSQVALVTAAAVQARLNLVALDGGVACFGTRAPTHAVALLDVVGAEAALASADDVTLTGFHGVGIPPRRPGCRRSCHPGLAAGLEAHTGSVGFGVEIAREHHVEIPPVNDSSMARAAEVDITGLPRRTNGGTRCTVQAGVVRPTAT
jgi:hypothetical protein